MAKVTGIVKIYLDGIPQRSKEGAKLITGGYERTMQSGYEVYGYSEKVVPSQIDFTLAHTADVDVETLNNLTEATVRFETDVGLSYLCTGMVTTKPVELTGGEGDLAVEMQGNPAVEEGLL